MKGNLLSFPVAPMTNRIKVKLVHEDIGLGKSKAPFETRGPLSFQNNSIALVLERIFEYTRI